MSNLNLERLEFINKVVAEYNKLGPEIKAIESFIEKLLVNGKPLILKIEGELEEVKPKSKIGESPFASPEGSGAHEAMAIQQMFASVGINAHIVHKSAPSNEEITKEALLEETIGEKMVYDVVFLILNEKRTRFTNCKNKLLEYGIEVEG